MNEKSIIFSGPMVRAILDGRKTQTRRPIIKIKKWGKVREFGLSSTRGYAWQCRDQQGRLHDLTTDRLLALGPWQVGNRLWVRETWAAKAWSQHECSKVGCADAATHPTWIEYGERIRAIYRASYSYPKDSGPWTPSVQMPRWASRITLEVAGVRVERLQDISEDDVAAEGVSFHVSPEGKPLLRVTGNHPPSDYYRRGDRPLQFIRAHFASLWDSINGKRHPWSSNPWVWVIEFGRMFDE